MKTIKEVLTNNKKVVENYFFMTTLQILNSFFYLLIYPFLIRTLGAESFGIYVFAMSISAYFTFLINFGFDMPATKVVAENFSNMVKLSEVLSIIYTAKTYLFFLASVVFLILINIIPIFQKYLITLIIGFVSIYSNVLFPQWFFQGIQNMKLVTAIQILTKICSLPLIFIFIRDSSDVNVYISIVSITTMIGAILAFLLVKFKYKIVIRFSGSQDIRPWFKEAQPFFYSTLAGSIKEYSIPIILGSFFGMREVAIYDLANKIVIVPRTLLSSVNAAIFPKLITNINNIVVKKIIIAELFVSLLIVILIAIFGNTVINIMGGREMHEAYYLSVLLSFTVISWLVVGAFINFVFIPNNKNQFIAKNQILAMSSFFIICFSGIFVKKDLLIIGISIAFSAMLEILYCLYVTKKSRLL